MTEAAAACNKLKKPIPPQELYGLGPNQQFILFHYEKPKLTQANYQDYNRQLLQMKQDLENTGLYSEIKIVDALDPLDPKREKVMTDYSLQINCKGFIVTRKPAASEA